MIVMTRRRMAAMARRMERDLAILDRMFPRVDLAEDFGNACEVIRNLATARSYAATFAAMSDEGVKRELDAYSSFQGDDLLPRKQGQTNE